MALDATSFNLVDHDDEHPLKDTKLVLPTDTYRIFSCRWSTNHFSLFLRLRMFVVGLSVTSKPSSQPIWLKV